MVGGTSLGANVALELAVRYPERAAALFIEMPVLDNALPAVAGAFTPVLLGLRAARPAFELTSRLTSLIPRTNYLVDIGLDWVRQRPGPSGAVLEGLLLGETAPHREQRLKIEQPTLIVGHPRDPVHPFSDSGMLAEELPNARLVEASSIFEWRLKPRAPHRGAGRLSSPSLPEPKGENRLENRRCAKKISQRPSFGTHGVLGCPRILERSERLRGPRERDLRELQREEPHP